MPPFIPGLQLSELFYTEAVQPILQAHFPDLIYSAALIGSGSEVLGFDTERSTDHEWGPRLQLFVLEDDSALHNQMRDTFAHHLPRQFRGYSTHFGPPDHEGVRIASASTSGPIAHRVDVLPITSFFKQYLGIDPVAPLDPSTWLTLPEQRLLSIVRGGVFHDGLGTLNALRSKLAYYPRDVWIYLLASQWLKISQEEPFVGRCGETGDELGSQVIAARLVREIMKLGFLIERQYAPYSKWFGTAFSRLQCGPALDPILRTVLHATDWHERERRLAQAYTIVAEMHNKLQLTPPLPTTVSRFHDRPFLVIHGEQFADALRAAISDEQVRQLPFPIGDVDQFVDSTDVLSYPQAYRRLDVMYRP